MINPESGDPYTAIAVMGLQDFELRGSGFAVPLTFKPDAAYITRRFLEQDEEFSKDLIVNALDFHDICGHSSLAASRLTSAMSGLRFTFTALHSTLIQVSKRGAYNGYQRNPIYTVIDEPGILARAE